LIFKFSLSIFSARHIKSGRKLVGKIYHQLTTGTNTARTKTRRAVWALESIEQQIAHQQNAYVQLQDAPSKVSLELIEQRLLTLFKDHRAAADALAQHAAKRATAALEACAQ
jgi:hypothetical protein